jgi:hypothetical protein
MGTPRFVLVSTEGGAQGPALPARHRLVATSVALRERAQTTPACNHRVLIAAPASGLRSLAKYLRTATPIPGWRSVGYPPGANGYFAHRAGHVFGGHGLDEHGREANRVAFGGQVGDTVDEFIELCRVDIEQGITPAPPRPRRTGSSTRGRPPRRPAMAS